MVGKTSSKSKATPKKTVAKKSVKTTAKPEAKASLKRKIITAAICIAVPVLAGLLSSVLTGDAMGKFADFVKPPLAPPAWLFPVAWTILYVMMGLASYFIIIAPTRTKQDKFERKVAVIVYLAQLAFNFVWTPIFFLAGDYFFALVWLIIMWLMIVVLMFWARHRSMTAVWLLLPYALWCLFAMYLNASIMILN